MNIGGAIQALWRGENVQTKHKTSGVWQPLVERFPTIDVSRIKNGFANWEFRIAPKTITIGGVECEAPVLEPEDGQTLYWIDQDYQVESTTYRKADHRFWASPLQHGDCFASPAAALAARNAITELLTGSGS